MNGRRIQQQHYIVINWAQHLNSFIRHADIVKMANITMLSSLAGNSPDGDFKNALFHAFYLFSNNCHGTALDVYTSVKNTVMMYLKRYLILMSLLC